MKKVVVIGADHRGFEHKESLKTWLSQEGWQVIDCGNTRYDQDDDYPDVAVAMGKEFAKYPQGNAAGILLCGSSVGVTIAANKISGVRAAAAFSEQEVVHGRSADDINVLTLSADYLDLNTAKKLIILFLNTEFEGAERHIRRINKMKEMENQ